MKAMTKLHAYDVPATGALIGKYYDLNYAYLYTIAIPPHRQSHWGP